MSLSDAYRLSRCNVCIGITLCNSYAGKRTEMSPPHRGIILEKRIARSSPLRFFALILYL